MLRYPKINIVATGLSIAILLTLSGLAVVLVPTLTTPVMATTTAPVPVPPAPLPAPKKLKTLVAESIGFASWYGSVLEGHHTASGERFERTELTAAHRTLPFGTMVRVVDLNTGNSVVVRINDRGVLFPERIIDLSSAAAEKLGILREGVAKVRLEVLKKASDLGVRQASTDVNPAAVAQSL